MFLLLTAAHADTWFVCDPVAIPADAWAYHDVSVNDPYREALAELEAWRDTTCTSSTCTFSSTDTYRCEETTCVTSAGALWYAFVEELYSGATTTRMEVSPPASAGLGWTWASIAVDDDDGTDGGRTEASVAWTGELVAGWPLDGSFRSVTEWTDAGYGGFASGSWESPTCAWHDAVLVDDNYGYSWWLSFDTVAIAVYEEYADCMNEHRIHATVDEVEYGAVEGDDWALDPMDADRDGYRGDVDDCNDADPAIYPCAPETSYDGVDSNCFGDLDRDGDGDATQDEGGGDCEDMDATIHSGAIDVPYDGIDQDCDGADLLDADGDGVDGLGGGGADCDDAAATVYPGAAEVECDGLDQDCDGADTCPPETTEEDTTCATSGGAAGVWAALLALTTLTRRARTSRR